MNTIEQKTEAVKDLVAELANNVQVAIDSVSNTLDLTPTWEGLLPAFTTGPEAANALRDMAQFTDRRNAESKASQAEGRALECLRAVTPVYAAITLPDEHRASLTDILRRMSAVVSAGRPMFSCESWDRIITDWQVMRSESRLGFVGCKQDEMASLETIFQSSRCAEHALIAWALGQWLDGKAAADNARLERGRLVSSKYMDIIELNAACAAARDWYAAYVTDHDSDAEIDLLEDIFDLL